MITETNSQVSVMKLSQDGNILAYGDGEGTNFVRNFQLTYKGVIHIHDLRKHQSVSSFEFGDEKITSLHLLNNKQIVASGETSIKLFDLSGIFKIFAESHKEYVGSQISDISINSNLEI